jgi:hypothetical protein
MKTHAFLRVLVALVDSGQLAGWVRALIASLFGLAAPYLVGWLAGFSDPNVQGAVGIVLSTLIVGAWSSIAKALTQEVPATVVTSTEKPVISTVQPVQPKENS